MIMASAPGSLMLLGEHAVLQGYPALVAALSQRLRVSLVVEGEGRWVASEKYGKANLDEASLPPQFSFVHAAFHQAQKAWGKSPQHSFTLHSVSEFSDTLGFGSSAAITVATLGVFWRLYHPQEELTPPHVQMLWDMSRESIRSVQGLGSGADAAASLVGGIVLCEPHKTRLTRIADTLPLVAVYSGAKRKTEEVVREMQKRLSGLSEILQALFHVSECLVYQGVEALKKNDIPRFGLLANIAQGVMDAYGVNTPVLQDLIQRLRTHAHVYGAKISGSGWGDCVIGMGELEAGQADLFSPYPVFALHIAQEGLIIETA